MAKSYWTASYRSIKNDGAGYRQAPRALGDAAERELRIAKGAP